MTIVIGVPGSRLIGGSCSRDNVDDTQKKNLRLSGRIATTTVTPKKAKVPMYECVGLISYLISCCSMTLISEITSIDDFSTLFAPFVLLHQAKYGHHLKFAAWHLYGHVFLRWQGPYLTCSENIIGFTFPMGNDLLYSVFKQNAGQ